MNVRCGICKQTYGCNCHEQEQLFVVADPARCKACNTTRPSLCQHDADISEGLISATRKRPKTCLNAIDPRTMEIPF